MIVITENLLRGCSEAVLFKNQQQVSANYLKYKSAEQVFAFGECDNLNRQAYLLLNCAH